MAQRVARASREHALHDFTPLLESVRGTGLRSQQASNGRRVYKGVTIIRAGLGNARDRNYYPAEMLERAVREGRFNDLRAFADHPDSVSEEIQPERTVRDLVGVYQRPRFLREGRRGGRVVADLNLVRSAKWLSDTIDDLIELKQADKIGLSINGRGKTVEKRIQLEEAADPMDVNEVEDFIVLRSADVVTEAGAGGGFQQLLESARGATRTRTTRETAMLTAKQKKAIKEAFQKNDTAALGKLLKECGCSLQDAAAIAAGKEPAAKEAKAGAGKGGRKTEEAEDKAAKRKGAAADADDAADDAADDDAADDSGDADDVAEVDHDAELDAAVDEVTGDDATDEGEEDDDLGEADGDEDDDDGDESDDDGDEDEGDVDEADRAPRRGDGRHPLSSAAERIRQSAASREGRDGNRGEAREAARRGGPLTLGSVGSSGRRVKIKGPGNGKTAVNLIGGRRKQGGGQKGRRFGEAAASTDALREVRRLREENARLSSQLRIRQTADRARKLLKESSIPDSFRPEVLKQMVGQNENQMRQTIRYHERLFEAAVAESAYSDMGDTGTRVEGAGSHRLRESFHGGDRGDNDFGSLLQEAGVPMRDED